jgi:hypothetical protein
MAGANLKNPSHSAVVRMELSVNCQVLSIAQLGPDFLILDAPFDHPPTTGEIAVWIDGHERRWPVSLVEGMTSGKRRTRTALVASPLPMP